MGAQRVDTNTRTCKAVGAIPQFARVKWAATPVGGDPKAVYVDVAAAADVPLGHACREAFAEGDPIAVLLNSASGTVIGIAAAAVVAGVVQNRDADGKYGPAGAGSPAGVAISAAAADGDYFEMVPIIE